METKLEAERRDDHGKGVARKLRAAGRVPAVFYGHDQETVPLSIDAREMFHVLHSAGGSNVLLDLVVDGKPHLAMDVTVLYVTSVAPFDADGLAREVADGPDVISVTPFLEGTLTPMLTSALANRPTRFTSIGVGNDVLREYGTVGDHDRARGLDEHGIRERIGRVLDR